MQNNDMSYSRKNRLKVEQYVEQILAGDIVALSQAITIAESTLEEDNKLSGKILDQILPHTGNSIRVGITGVPGVGKSTFIEAIGKYLTGKGRKIAVLAVDPSSKRTKGSILGDKTRMEALASDPNAYIRPSPSLGVLGGIANKTREIILLCEAAGFNTILVETVGVGQSEIAVKGMVDFFLLLMLAGAGDELQGIKKGIMEMADAIVINKADGEMIKAAKRARAEYQSALHLFPLSESGWQPKVMTCSSTTQEGIVPIWNLIMEYEAKMGETQFFHENRTQQDIEWVDQIIVEKLKASFYTNTRVKKLKEEVITGIKSGKLTAKFAAEQLIDTYYDKK